MRVRRAAASLVALAAIATPADAVAAEPSPISVGSEEHLSGRLTEYTLRTPALSGETVVRVLRPRGYAEHPGRRYPVLYLLHGCCSYEVRGSQAWTVNGEAEQATEGLPLIVVMPDGGRGGFYTDWFNNGLGGPPRWEEYHVGQLIPWVDARFRTRAEREGRAVAGLSMGGFGAMKYAARHPDRFVAAATFSGAVDSNLFASGLDAVAAQDGAAPGSVFGVREAEEVRWRGHNPWDLAENLRSLQLAIRGGNGQRGELDQGGGPPLDPLEASTYEQSVSLHRRFDALGIEHTWDDYGAGTHTWPYWARSLRRTLAEQMRVFDDPPPRPRSITYTAIEPEYAVYGWSVKLRRPALEFSRLEGAGTDGFAITGSGRADVVTPPYYKRGAAYRAGRSTLFADDTGRLRVSVTLGPANATQQYRPAAEWKVFRTHVPIEPAPSAAAPPRSVPCASRRKFRVTIPRRLKHVRATVAGRRVSVRGKRRRFVVVDLRRRPAGVYRVVITGRGGRRIVRTFRKCARRPEHVRRDTA